MGLAAGFAAAAVIANVYPFEPRSNTFALAVLHLPIALWLLVGIAYAGGPLARERGPHGLRPLLGRARSSTTR